MIGALPFVIAPVLILLCLAGVACGEERDTRVRGDVLSVYVSVPRHGVSANGGRAVLAGARRALADARGRVRGRRVRVVAVSSTKATEAVWDPGAVEAAAERAAKDPSAIAYIGELDSGASAVSLPVTNAARLLQISPADGLTSLTRSPPGRTRAGPERLRPEGVRSFLRLAPADVQVARTLVRRLRARRARRVAIVHTGGVGERELATLLARSAEGRDIESLVVEARRDEPGEANGVVRDVAAYSPDAVVLAGVPGPGTAAVLQALATRVPRAEVLCTGTMLRPGGGEPNPRCGLTLASPWSVRDHSGEAMRLVLEAIARGGPDRNAVTAAALAPRERRSPLGRYAVRRNGDVAGLGLAFRAAAKQPGERTRAKKAP